MGGCRFGGAGVCGAEGYKVMGLGATGLRGCKIGGTGGCGVVGLGGLRSCGLGGGGSLFSRVLNSPNPTRGRGCVALAATRVHGDSPGGPRGAPALEGGIA